MPTDRSLSKGARRTAAGLGQRRPNKWVLGALLWLAYVAVTSAGYLLTPDTTAFLFGVPILAGLIVGPCARPILRGRERE